ncbi:hypothetical protein AJ80_04994 [Polytolypa hystricis UAMH7299]|uniref:PH domain-containing protein n=1 Tax=Polytolypa hystricis (strain UAMH7299) TaxID=1447883 RepID=A0A2B7Y609_POLH7|nr:hypothetical protein AJ80_04994 [Polytolypa hystricis UAMH7299]
MISKQVEDSTPTNGKATSKRQPARVQPISQSGEDRIMKPIIAPATLRPVLAFLSPLRAEAPRLRYVHSSASKGAVAHPINVHGPPPKTPVPTPEFTERIERRKKQSEALREQVKDATKKDSKSPLKKRFWKDVHVKELPEGYQILLDTRPVRTPTKETLTIPPSKPHLAHAIALEWDLLVSAHQALKTHLIPLTSLAARAEDIAQQDAADEDIIRREIVWTMMRYLDTDTLLTWAPEKNIYDGEVEEGTESLRDRQIRTAQPIIAFLVGRVWPGIEIKPTLESNSIMPTPQPPVTKEVIRGWVSGLPAYELAGLERGVLASKSLLVATRLLVEWSENFRHLRPEGRRAFGIEQAAEASSVEVTWQTGNWGEVEDTHDVEKEDLKRQLGAVVLLVSGETKYHKRSKSALALSILHRDKSKKDDGREDDGLSSEHNHGSPASGTSSPTNEASRHSHSLSMTNLRASRRKAGPDITSSRSTLSMNAGSQDTTEEQSLFGKNAEGQNNPASGPSRLEISSMSIEQSVRTFRLFEVLRSGDTTAISKAVKECCDAQNQSDITPGTSILHLAIQCADPQVVEYVLSTGDELDVNARDRDGNTPLHLSAQLGRLPIVRELLSRPDINDAVTNYQGQTPLDLARTPDIFQQLQLARSLFLDTKTKEIHGLVAQGDYDQLESLLVSPRVESTLDVNSLDLATDRATAMSGGTLLHEAARKKDIKLIQILLMHGADPFRRDRKGKLPQDVTKDDRTRAIVKKSPAAVMAQRGIQEKAILGSAAATTSGDIGVGSKDAREMKGYLKKWTNYTSGYKLRWFVLEDGVLSYYKHQDDAGSACRGAINMRIAKLHMDPQDKTRFEIQGKSSVKYHLKANHVVEAKRWFWALNNAIQWAKDEAREDDRRREKDAEVLRQAKMDQIDRSTTDSQTDSMSIGSSRLNTRILAPSTSLGVPNPNSSKLSFQSSRGGTDSGVGDEEGYASGPSDAPYQQSDINRASQVATTNDGEDDDYGDDSSSRELQPSSKDAFSITAQSVKLQLDLLGNVAAALQAEKTNNPTAAISDPAIEKALNAYEGAVSSLHSLVADLLKISKDRDAYWQYRLDRESDARKMWEDSMARVAQEHEELQSRIGESEDRRKRTKKALREALEQASVSTTRQLSQAPSHIQISDALGVLKENVTEAENDEAPEQPDLVSEGVIRKKSVIAEFTDLSDLESDEEEEFFDAIDAGEVEVIKPSAEQPPEVEDSNADARASKHKEIVPSFRGYEDPVRLRLSMDSDDRPRISLWGILKSMIGKDMTKMTLPVSFNEPTSLLQRVAEDMEYADLIDVAADRTDSLERLVHVAAFAASEYASTIGRVAKPFNPLLGETFEYVRPDKGYRFYVEQVSHHPPIGAAYAESSKWEYYGESALKSKFYGKSFEINLLGTWFLKLRPITGGEELYTWKKVTSSVVGIITGNPTVDNHGRMEIKNWATGETCVLDFKPRGWKAASAYQVSGKVMDKHGQTKWSIGGRWNDKIYARHTPGYEGSVTPPVDGEAAHEPHSAQAFLVWQAHDRPRGIPFNLTPFGVTLNAIPDSLKPHLPPTDTRLRPDQRAMEDGEYDFAASEKHRVEEKQRAKRREREKKGEEFVPKWFQRGKCDITGEEYWVPNGNYWKSRESGDWSACEDIF